MAELTVVIPVWDEYCAFVRECVDSVLAQDVATEVIVVDNASTEQLPDLPGVRVVRSETRLSAGAARNFGLELVETPLVAFVDADDVVLPGTFRFLAERLAEKPSRVAAAAALTEWDPATGEQRPHSFPRAHVYPLSDRRRLLAAYHLGRCAVKMVDATVMRTEAVRDAGGFGEGDYAEDWQLAASLAARGPIGLYRRPGALYRVQAGLSAAPRTRTDWRETFRALRSRVRRDPRTPLLVRALLPLFAVLHELKARVQTGARPLPWLLGGTLFAGALAVRLHEARRGLLYPDGYQYLLMARGISEHLRPITQFGPGGDLFVPNADAAAKPLYPALIALVHLFGAGWLFAARLVTALGGAAAVALTGLLGRRLTGSTPAGLAGALLLLVSPALAFWSGFSGPDPVAQALALAAALALLDRRVVLGGVLAGLACATRPELLLLALAAVAIRRDRHALRAATAAAFTLAAVLLVLRPPLELPQSKLLLLAPLLLALAVVPLRAAVALAAAQAPAFSALWHHDWPLLLLAAAGLALGRRSRPALYVAGAAVLLAAVYWQKNAALERYTAILLPAAALLAAFAVSRARAAALAVVPAAVIVLALHAPAVGNRQEDSFSALAPQLAALPAGPLVSAAPDAYSFWLPGRTIRLMRPGARGYILLDSAQRLYEPLLGATGRLVTHVTGEAAFFRPDGGIDLGRTTVIAGVVRTRPPSPSSPTSSRSSPASS